MYKAAALNSISISGPIQFRFRIPNFRFGFWTPGRWGNDAGVGEREQTPRPIGNIPEVIESNNRSSDMFSSTEIGRIGAERGSSPSMQALAMQSRDRDCRRVAD